MTTTNIFDQYLQWWQSASAQYLEMAKNQPVLMKVFGFSLERYLESKRIIDCVLDEWWRSFRLPTLEEVIRIHQRMNSLESRLAALQERNGAEERAAIREDLKSMKEALEKIERQATQRS
jgi:hypothetical protein